MLFNGIIAKCSLLTGKLTAYFIKKLMTLKMGMHLVSQLRWGQEKQIIRFKEYCNFYEIMMGMQEANLTAQNKTTGASMQNQLRADYLRSCLPEIVQP